MGEVYRKVYRSGISELRIADGQVMDNAGLLVRTLYASVCFWADWNFFRGLSESVKDIGHESVVEVLEDGRGFRKGQRIGCYYQEGAFSEIQVINTSEVAIATISEKLDLKQAVFCELVFSVSRMIDGLHAGDFDEVYVGGGGPVGIVTALLLNRIYPHLKVSIIEINPHRREVLDNRGFRMKEYAEMDQAALFIDCFGENRMPEPEKNYLEIFSRLRCGAQYIVFGHSVTPVSLPFSMISRKNIVIRGVRTDLKQMRKLVPLVTELIHTVDFSWMILEEIRFSEIPEWFQKTGPDLRTGFKTGIIFE